MLRLRAARTLAYFILWLLLALVPATTQATTVVVIWTKEKIVVAADSLRLWRAAGGVPSYHDLVCKVDVAGEFVTSASGMVVSETLNANGERRRSNANLDLMKLLDNAARGSSSVDDAMRRAVVVMKSALEVRAKADKQRSAQDFAQHYRQHGVKFLIAKYDRQRGSTIRVMMLLVSADGKVTPEPDDAVPLVPAEGHVRQNVLGDDGAIENLMSSNGEAKVWYQQGTPLPDVAARLVGIQAAADPENVGGPISVLTIDAKGIHWINRGVCTSNPANSTKTAPRSAANSQ